MTRPKTTLAALVLAALPGIAFAACGGHSLEEARLSCADGLVWDADTQACVPSTS